MCRAASCRRGRITLAKRKRGLLAKMGTGNGRDRVAVRNAKFGSVCFSCFVTRGPPLGERWNGEQRRARYRETEPAGRTSAGRTRRSCAARSPRKALGRSRDASFERENGTRRKLPLVRYNAHHRLRAGRAARCEQLVGNAQDMRLFRGAGHDGLSRRCIRRGLPRFDELTRENTSPAIPSRRVFFADPVRHVKSSKACDRGTGYAPATLRRWLAASAQPASVRNPA